MQERQLQTRGEHIGGAQEIRGASGRREIEIGQGGSQPQRGSISEHCQRRGERGCARRQPPEAQQDAAAEPLGRQCGQCSSVTVPPSSRRASQTRSGLPPVA